MKSRLIRSYLLAAAIVCVTLCVAYFSDRNCYTPQPVAVYENSSSLTHTAIVPAFDTPMPKGKNVIWCASFQLAWDKLAEDVLHGPVELADAPECASHLNKGQFTEADLPANGYLAMAGLCRDGIAQKILDEMQRRFRRQPKFDVSNPFNVIIAYAYLEASVPFTVPYCQCHGQISFRDSNGTGTQVAFFGTSDAYGHLEVLLRDQFRILYCSLNKERRLDEFVIDPCQTSQPNQIILACVRPASTLAETWQRVESLTTNFARNPKQRKPNDLDNLLVPDMAWDITHSFAELQGKELLNKGFDNLFIASAQQAIRLRLDRGGAELRSETRVAVKSVDDGQVFIFDRPFFIFIKKRDGKKPFFAMYVDNAELLQKWKAEE
mgnify:CR=1 FL=1